MHGHILASNKSRGGTYVQQSDLKGSTNSSDGIVIKLQAGKLMNQN
jgi:hypothetical protein